jgi:hypothetical protein
MLLPSPVPPAVIRIRLPLNRLSLKVCISTELRSAAVTGTDDFTEELPPTVTESH